MASTVELARGVLLVVVFSVSAVTDLRYYKVPNAVVVPGTALSIALASLVGLEELVGTFLGLLLGAFLLWPFYRRGGVGGGDVKLLAFVGAAKGVWFVANTAVLAAFIGGVWALWLFARAGRLRSGLEATWGLFLTVVGLKKSFAPKDSRAVPAVPYAVCIALGGMLTSVRQSVL